MTGETSSRTLSTQQEMELMQAQIRGWEKQGLDPERGANLLNKIIQDSKKDKYGDLKVKNARDALDKPVTPRAFSGLPTGLKELDDKFLFGLRPGDLVIVSGNPGLGKSSFCAYAAMNIVRAGHKALFYNFEDGEEEYENRLRLLAKGNGFKKDEMKGLYYYGMEEMAPFYSKPLEIVHAIRGAVIGLGVEIVFVDMLNDLVKVNTADQADELVRELNNLAKELKIVIVATAKMRKTQGYGNQDKMVEKYYPTSEAISGFNTIESYATKIIMISRVPSAVLQYESPKAFGEPYKEPFAIHVTKCRTGNKTIDLGQAYVCQWLKYNGQTTLDQKGMVEYAPC